MFLAIQRPVVSLHTLPIERHLAFFASSHVTCRFLVFFGTGSKACIEGGFERLKDTIGDLLDDALLDDTLGDLLDDTLEAGLEIICTDEDARGWDNEDARGWDNTGEIPGLGVNGYPDIVFNIFKSLDKLLISIGSIC